MSDELTAKLGDLREMLIREGYRPTPITSQALVDEMWTRSPGLVGLTFTDGTYVLADLSPRLAIADAQERGREDALADAYERGRAIESARAESRQALGLPLSRDGDVSLYENHDGDSVRYAVDGKEIARFPA